MKKYGLIKLVVVNVLLLVAYLICDSSWWDFFPSVTYSEDEVRIVIDNNEVTKQIPDAALIKDDKVFLSFQTIQKYFDKYIYFDEKYQTIILTNADNIMKLKLDDNVVTKNGEEKQIMYPATKSGDIIYVPMEDTEDMFGIKVEYHEKVIISTKNVDYMVVKMPKKGKVKLKNKEFSGTVEKYLENDVLTVFPSDQNGEFVKVRTTKGNFGFVKNEVIAQGEKISGNEVMSKDATVSKKINLTWEYAENFTPDRSSESKIEGLNVISPTWFYMKNSSGDVKNTISTSYVSWAKQNGYKLWPTVKNDKMGLDGTSALVTDMYAREKFMNEIVLLAKQYDFEGINMDFEFMNQEDIEEYSQFIREFSAVLRRNGLIVSIDVTVPDGDKNWSLCYDRHALSDAVDYMVLMAYDQYGKLQDGPVASLGWVKANIQKMLDQESVPKEKLILGVPFYSKQISYQEAFSGDKIIKNNVSGFTFYMQGAKKHLKTYEKNATWDELMGQYVVEIRNGNQVNRTWIEDEKALELKVKLVDEYGLAGVASWRWGFETNDAWKMIKNNVSGL